VSADFHSALRTNLRIQNRRSTRLDRLDLGILKSLLLNNGVPPGYPTLRKSFRTIAKELGVDQGTVRKRIRAFQEQRVLKGWYLGISPGLTGHDVVYAWLSVENEDSKSRIIGKLLRETEVERVCNYLGPKLSLVLFCKKGAEPDTLRRLEGRVGPGVTLHMQGRGNVPIYRPRTTELAIIGSLQRDPWRQFSVVAKEIGASSRTVKRVVSRLSDGGLTYMLPIIDLKALQGIVPVEVVVEYASPELKAEANSRILPYVKEGLVFSDIRGPFGYFAIVVTNVSQVEQITRWVRQQNGVGDVHSEVLQDVMLNQNHYGRQEILARPEITTRRTKAGRTS